MDPTAHNKLVPLVKGLVAMRVLNMLLSVATVILASLGAANGIYATAIISAYFGGNNAFGDALAATIGWSIAMAAIAFLSFLQSLVALIMDGRPGRRAASCAPGCRTFCCDLSWDVALGCCWVVLLAINIIGYSVVGISLCTLQLAFHIICASLSGVANQYVRQGAGGAAKPVQQVVVPQAQVMEADAV